MSELTPSTATPVTGSTRTLTGSRIAIAAAVIALAVAAGGALGAFLLAGDASGFGPSAGYVSADAPIYVEVRVEPSADQDAALRELLGRFPPIDGVALDRPLYEQLTEHLDELLGGDPTFSWEADVAPWFGGTVALALTDVPGSAATSPTEPFDAEQPPFLVLVAVTDAAAARASADRLAAESGTPATTEHLGVEIVEVGSGAYAVTDDHLLVAPTADIVRSALDARAGGQTLAAGDAFGDLTAGMPDDWLARGAYDMSGFLAESFAADAGGSPNPAAAFEELFANQPMRAAFTVSAAGDRLAVMAASDVPTGAFAPTNADRGLADEVPSDAVYYADGGNVGRSAAEVIAAIKEAMSSDPSFAETIATTEAALGTEIEEMVSWIGDGAMVAGWDGDAPYVALVLVPTDVSAAERRLDQLASFARLAAMDPSAGLAVSEGELDGETVTTIRWQPEDSGAELGMTPPGFELVVEYAVTDDRALVALGDGVVARLLTLDAASSLASQPGYAEAVAELGGTSNAGVGWLDFDNALAAVDGLIGSSGIPGMEPLATNEWLAPLDRVVGVSRVDGDRLVIEVILTVE